jgi:transportin-1
MAWVPQEAGLVQLCTLFAELQKGSNQAQVGFAIRVSSGSTQDQVLQHVRFHHLAPQILAQLDQYRLYPDFNNYLAFIFAKGDQVPIDVSAERSYPCSLRTPGRRCNCWQSLSG